MKVTSQKVNSPRGEITLVTVVNNSGASVTLSSLGAGIIEVCVPDKDGHIGNVALRYADPADYIADGPCMGKVPGRYANRIAKGELVIDGVKHQLAVNNGPNALHGGPEGFQNQIWETEILSDGVRFTYHSKNGEEHYPGSLTASATYTWSEDNVLTLRLEADTDAPTVVNLTNHAYWNLDGADSGTVLDHELTMRASRYLPTDDTLIPTGEMAPVTDTPMDFTVTKTLGRDIKAAFPALEYGKGYDACWVIDDYTKGVLAEDVVVLQAPRSGRVLTVSTTQPGVQIYTGNWLEGCPNNCSGCSYADYDGVAIEAQGLPDAPHHSTFPSQLLRPGEHYDETIRFAFSVR